MGLTSRAMAAAAAIALLSLAACTVNTNPPLLAGDPGPGRRAAAAARR